MHKSHLTFITLNFTSYIFISWTIFQVSRISLDCWDFSTCGIRSFNHITGFTFFALRSVIISSFNTVCYNIFHCLTNRTSCSYTERIVGITLRANSYSTSFCIFYAILNIVIMSTCRESYTVSGIRVKISTAFFTL